MMDLNWLSPTIVVFLLWTTHVQGQITSFTLDDESVVDTDVKNDSKQALLNAWKKACATDGGTVVILKGSTFLLSDAEFSGPCKGQTNFILNGTLIAPPAPTPNLDYWIKFTRVDRLSVSGDGTIDGNGAAYWKSPNPNVTITSLKLQFVTKSSIKSIHSINSKKFHMGVNNCDSVSIDGVNITAPGNSPNTDGIHLGVSNNITITNSDIATGDDCISIGPGSTNINITGITCGPGHGISIGSLGKYPAEKEVRSILVSNCTFTQTQNGLRIKTFAAPLPGLASNIIFEHIMMNDAGNPIIIDQHYCPHGICSSKEDEDYDFGDDIDDDEEMLDDQVDALKESNLLIENVKFIDVKGSSNEKVGVKIACSKTKPCQDIELVGVNLTFRGQPTIANCSSADVRFLGPVQVPSRCS